MTKAVITNLALVLGIIGLSPAPIEASPIPLVNGDFEAGGLGGWTTFVTANGVIQPAVVSFDVNGDSVPNKAAQFLVGQVAPTPGVTAGGGVFQSFVSGAGMLTMTVDIAAYQPGATANGAGGLFTLLLDGLAVDSFDFGAINSLGIEREVLSAAVGVSAGSHEVRLLMTRLFLPAPEQFIDDVRLDLAAPVPEPETVFLVAVGLTGLAYRRSLASRRS